MLRTAILMASLSKFTKAAWRWLAVEADDLGWKRLWLAWQWANRSRPGRLGGLRKCEPWLRAPRFYPTGLATDRPLSR